jgi:hypothetical protein
MNRKLSASIIALIGLVLLLLAIYYKQFEQILAQI